jgi:AcrR family transcriptional regulator
MSKEKEKIVVVLAEVFLKYGYGGATLSRISEATDLSRASLYHYFPQGKQEMAMAVLNFANKLFQDQVLSTLRQKGKPHERLLKMIKGLRDFYRCGENACLLGVFAIGEAGALFATNISTAFERWMDEITEVLVETGFDPEHARRKAENTVVQIQGAILLARAFDDAAYFERTVQNLSVELRAFFKPALENQSTVNRKGVHLVVGECCNT